MNRLIFTCALAFVLFGQDAFGRAEPEFRNEGNISSPPDLPPQIDATNFINTGSMNINVYNFTNLNFNFFGSYLFSTPVSLFQFSDTLNFTNRGTMASDAGFRFDTYPTGGGPRHTAANFVNQNPGTILAGSATNFQAAAGLVFFFGVGGPQIRVDATNVVNTGIMDVGLNGLVSIKGQNVNLSRGGINSESSDDFDALFGGFGFTFNLGLYANYWAAGRDTNNSGFFQLPNPQSPIHRVTTPFNQQVSTIIAPPNAQAFVSAFSYFGGNDIGWQVVFVGNTNNNITTDVRFEGAGFFPFGVPVVEWKSVTTNALNQTVNTNLLFLSDTFGSQTNLQVVTNSFNLTGQPALAPVNYTLFRAFPTNFFLQTFDNLPQANFPFDPAIFNNSIGVTNDYTAYSVTTQPVTAIPDPFLPTANVTNTPGRIEITADKVLDLTRARISGANYIMLQATNHFIGSANAQISAPYYDINLGSTNGLITMSNVLASSISRYKGDISMWSGRWTNIVAGVTNRFHVLMVDSRLTTLVPILIKDLKLRSTNTTTAGFTSATASISDILNVYNTFQLVSDRLTITTNGPGSATANGEINLLNNNIFWPASTPILKYLTNYGRISSQTITSFRGQRSPPYYASTFQEPYLAMVNHGSIVSSGNTIWANYFENSGTGVITTNSAFIATTNLATIASSAGPISVTADTMVLTNGSFLALAGDVTLAGSTIIASNHPIVTSYHFSVTATNQFTDGGLTSSNFWQVGDGFDLPIKPAMGDLLGTTIRSTASAFQQVISTWAGVDRGPSPAGFQDNAAIGRLILDGGEDCLFTFNGATGSNALYVDLLDLRNAATNRVNPNFPNLDIDPSITIYFADATVSGNLDVSEKLDHANGNRFRWVPSYAGLFSSTNITYPSGKTYTFNRALALSSSVDSNGNGIPNSSEPFPFFVPENVALSVRYTNQPVAATVLSWMTLANATNHLEFKTNLASAAWTDLTNFVTGPANGSATFTHRATNGASFYRVRLDPRQP